MFCCLKKRKSNDDQILVEQNSTNQTTPIESTPPRATSSITNPRDAMDTRVQETEFRSYSNIGPASSQSREYSRNESLDSTTPTVLHFPYSEDTDTEGEQPGNLARSRSDSLITICDDAEWPEGDDDSCKSSNAEFDEGTTSPHADPTNPGPSGSAVAITTEDQDIEPVKRRRTTSETSSFYSVGSSQSYFSAYSNDMSD